MQRFSCVSLDWTDCHPLSLVRSFLPVWFLQSSTPPPPPPPCRIVCGIWYFQCFSCFTGNRRFKWVGASDWGSVKGTRDLLGGGGGGGGGNLWVCDRERKGGAAREGVHCMRERVCMQLDEKLSVDLLLLCYTSWEKRHNRRPERKRSRTRWTDWDRNSHRHGGRRLSRESIRTPL